MHANGSGIAKGGDYLHNSPPEAQKFNVVQLLISGMSAPTFGNTLLAVRASPLLEVQSLIINKWQFTFTH